MKAFAIRLDHLIKSGQVADQAELARVGHVSRARLTQVMDLNLLAPDIQEEILDLPLVRGGKDNMLERDLRPIAKNTGNTGDRLKHLLAAEVLMHCLPINSPHRKAQKHA